MLPRFLRAVPRVASGGVKGVGGSPVWLVDGNLKYFKVEKESNTLQYICIYSTNIGAISLKFHLSKVYCLNLRDLKFVENIINN